MERRLGPYRIVAALGAGGMGQVYEAYLEPRERRVALKLLPAQAVSDTESLNRFQREMRFMATIHHPNLVEALDGGVIDNTPYIAMEFLEGQTLQTLVEREGPLDAERARRILIDMAQGLAALHARGIIHRDTKAANVMVSPQGRAKLIDFGLAKKPNSTPLTATGNIVGTLPILAPELLNGLEQTPLSDMWALGCTLYFMLTGKPPFDAQDFASLRKIIESSTLPDPRTVQPRIPSDLVGALFELLERNPNKRLGSAAVLAMRLATTPVPQRAPALTPDQAQESQDRDRRTAAARRRSKSASRRRRLVRFVSFGFLLIATAAATYFWFRTVPVPVPVPVSVASPVPTPITSSLPPGYRSAFRRWQDLEAPLARASKSQLDGPTIRKMTDISGLDLGHSAATWSYWVRLNRWLESKPTADDPPRSSLAPREFKDSHSEQAELYLRAFSHPTPPDSRVEARYRQLSIVVPLTASCPWDPRPWLALGRLADLDELPEHARLLYRVGLRHHKPVRLQVWPQIYWDGLVGALMQSPDIDLEKSWPSFVGLDNTGDAFLIALEHVLASKDPGRLVRILQSPNLAPMLVPPARVRLAYFRANQHEFAAARQLLNEVLATAPGYVPARKALAEQALMMGDSAAARQLLSDGPANPDWLFFCDYADGRIDKYAHDPRWQTAVRKDFACCQIEILRLLEDGQLAAAEDRFRHKPGAEANVALYWQVAVELLAAGSTLPQVIQVWTECASVAWDWPPLAGVLSLPAATRYMEPYLAKMSTRLTAKEDRRQLDICRALWLGRRGLISESLDQLEHTAFSPTLNAMELSCILELLARPVWQERSGATGRLPVADRARRMAAKMSLNDQYWSALNLGQMEKTAQASRDLILRAGPTFPSAVVLTAWATARLPNDRSRSQEFARLRVMTRHNRLGIWLLRELAHLEQI